MGKSFSHCLWIEARHFLAGFQTVTSCQHSSFFSAACHALQMPVRVDALYWLSKKLKIDARRTSGRSLIMIAVGGRLRFSSQTSMFVHLFGMSSSPVPSICHLKAKMPSLILISGKFVSLPPTNTLLISLLPLRFHLALLFVLLCLWLLLLCRLSLLFSLSLLLLF